MVVASLGFDDKIFTFVQMNPFNCLAILGPTASGKTKLAVNLAFLTDGEVISADSRQVYRQLDIGSGKDLEEYKIGNKLIPYHLINVANPEDQFFLHDFVAGLQQAFLAITARKKLPIICGGTGLYLDALQHNFELTQIPENQNLRAILTLLSHGDLLKKLKSYPAEHTQQVDLKSSKRLIRGIEIAEYKQQHPFQPPSSISLYQPFYIGTQSEVQLTREKIKTRLLHRLSQGLIEEVEHLLAIGLSHERLQRFGLEYKFISRYLCGELTRDELEIQLTTAIQQFAKRQMTWFRKMERSGIHIHWLPASTEMADVLALIRKEAPELLGETNAIP